MYIYYDRQGNIKEFINDSSSRKGTANSWLYVYKEEELISTVPTISIGLPDKPTAIAQGVVMTAVTSSTEKEIPFDKERDLKYFEYGKEYPFYKINLSDITGALSENRVITFTTWYGANATGLYPLMVTDAVVDLDSNITLSQWQYFLSVLGINNVKKVENMPVDLSSYNVGDLLIDNAGNVKKVIETANVKSLQDFYFSGYLTEAQAQNVYVKLADAQTITGVKTFNNLPVSSVEPTIDSHLTNKAYVDDVAEDLAEQIEAIQSRGRYLSTWNCVLGKADTNPSTSPYSYKTGDYFIVSTIATEEGQVNRIPTGSTYTIGDVQSEITTDPISVNDTLLYDGTNWTILHSGIGTAAWGSIVGTLSNQTDLNTALNGKQAVLTSANAGTDISITEVDGVKKINCTKEDIEYTAGTGISIDSENEISIDDTIVAKQSDIANDLKNVAFSYSGDNVSLIKTKHNDTTATEQVALANTTTAGLMSPSDYNAITNLNTRVGALEGQNVRLRINQSSPTASQVLAFVVAQGYTDQTKYSSVAVVDNDNHVWKWVNSNSITLEGDEYAFKETISFNGFANKTFTFDIEELSETYYGMEWNYDELLYWDETQEQDTGVYYNGAWVNQAYRSFYNLNDITINNTFATFLYKNLVNGTNIITLGAFSDFGLDTVNQFTNATAGVIKGSQSVGRVYAENDGTGSVYGWDNLNGSIAPQYDSTATYSVGDKVMHEGSLYECNTAITTAEQWDATKWTAINVVSKLGAGVSAIAYNNANNTLAGLSIGGVNYKLVPYYFGNYNGTPYYTSLTIFGSTGNSNASNSMAIGLNSSYGGNASTAIGYNAKVDGAGGVNSIALGYNSFVRISNAIAFDSLNGTENNGKTILLSNLSKIFLYNGTYTNAGVYVGFSNGYTLAERLNGLCITNSAQTELDYDKTLITSIGADTTFSFRASPTSTGSALSCKPTYEAIITILNANVSITLPSGVVIITNDTTNCVITNNVAQLVDTTKSYELNVRDNKAIIMVW